MSEYTNLRYSPEVRSLAKRLQYNLLDKFNQDKRKTIAYLQKQCQFFSHKADTKRGTKHHDKWLIICYAYADAEFAVSYWLSLDEEMEKDYLFDDLLPDTDTIYDE